jgi:hypothetical protein
MTKTRRKRLMLSIPDHQRAWLDEQADANCTSVNAEIVRSVKERRERVEAEERACC